MAETKYWDKLLQSRLNRRRALVGAASVGAGAAALSLVGCGGGGGGGGNQEAVKPSDVALDDTTAQAKTGGIYRLIQTQDPTNFDPNLSTSFTAQGVAAHVYSRLLKFDTGPGIVPLGKTKGDAAETFEASDGGQTWTFKIRKDMKFHAKGPASINGRALDSEDVAASYQYFVTKNASRATLTNKIDKIETPDKSTVVLKLKQPYAPLQELMASSALLWIMSKQATAGEVDTQKVEGAIGTGPWILDKAQPSIAIDSKRNPNWYEKVKTASGEVSLPLMDGLTYLNIPDYAQNQAQFLAGNIYEFAVRNTDLVDFGKQKTDALKLRGNPGWLLSFFYFNLENATNPFKDDRVRRALSMAIDRDGLIENFGDIAKLKAGGFDVNTGWSSSPIPWGDGGLFWWLDPKGKDMGAASAWYKYDLTQAKALLSAAGYKGEPFDLNTTNTVYGTTFDQQTEAMLPMLTAAGFKQSLKSEDYTSKYFPEVFTKFNFPHAAYGYQTPVATVDEYVDRMLSPGGDKNQSRVKDDNLTALVRKQQLELDANKRQAIIYDIQRACSDKMYYVPTVVGRWGGFVLFQPFVRNFGAFTTAAYGRPVESLTRYWMDKA